jgi:hypothetical protein
MPRYPRAGRVIPSVAAGTWAAAGNRFTKLRIVPPVPVGAYASKITSVPLTGGQAQGIIPGIPGTSGTATSPPAFTILGNILTLPVAGTYTVNWTVTLSGTTGGADANNFQLGLNGSLLAASVNAGAPGTYPQAPVRFTAAAGDQIVVVTGASNGTTGSVYGASISQAASPLTLQAGPQGLGTTWYPAQITLSTTTGALDTSTALVYLGIGGVPTQLVATVFSGNGTAAVAVPSMQPGEFIIVTWAGGHVGDNASFNIIGTMDALTTGRPG